MIGLDEYDWIKIRKTLRDFKEEQECMIPCIDLIPEQVDKLITDFSKIDLLIVDGLYAIKASDIDMRVFIDLTYHETKINQIIRMKEALSDFRLGILENEHQAVSSLKSMANLVVELKDLLDSSLYRETVDSSLNEVMNLFLDRDRRSNL